MSSRRGSASKLTEDEVNDLIFKLQASLPHESNSTSNKKRSASKILERTCIYIKKLQKEVDDLSDVLSKRLASGDINAADAELIATLLQL
ncbi:transcription factor ILI3-like [Salvia splendens]|uniref:transcription factor ILI3-like n=1 Tax=Salvia splendens TaxID=180675 RepID=UPI001C26CD4F|nr:transcription factor ILI3-like [Salvia splendens]